MYNLLGGPPTCVYVVSTAHLLAAVLPACCTWLPSVQPLKTQLIQYLHACTGPPSSTTWLRTRSSCTTLPLPIRQPWTSARPGVMCQPTHVFRWQVSHPIATLLAMVACSCTFVSKSSRTGPPRLGLMLMCCQELSHASGLCECCHPPLMWCAVVVLVCRPAAEVEAVLEQLLHGVDEELQLHDSYAASWSVDSKQLAAPSAATKAYTDFLMQVAHDPEVSRHTYSSSCGRAWMCQQLLRAAVQGVASIVGVLRVCCMLHCFKTHGSSGTKQPTNEYGSRWLCGTLVSSCV